MKDKEEKSADLPKKFQEIISSIEKMNVLELSELVKALENKFGVSAMPVITAGVSGVQTGAEISEEKSEQTSFNVELKSAGSQKIQVIKILKESLGLGLKDAKDLTDAVPKIIKEGISRKEAEDLKKKLEEAGAAVEIK